MSIRRQEALDYHAQGRPGKIQVSPTKPFKNQRDLSLAYTPGVAEPCREIAARPEEAYTYTAKGNLVAVVTNGTAVLGLGNIGPLAGKPVMEGKGILFKAFAAIDVFDLEVGSEDPEDMIRFCRLLEPTVGGINLEDIRSPDCFHIEKTLRDTLSIPVFHDDQHGTAIITGAALLNALELVKKDIGSVRVVFAGAGAAAIATAEHYVRLGVSREHITLCDQQGVVHADRSDLDEYRRRFAVRGKARTLAEALKDADVFVGLSVGGIVTGEMLKGMAKRPIVFALANPNPEITPEEARQARSDAIIATGRSDYPNQVNNVLGFPFIFRGALDVRAKKINDEMEMAATRALAALAKEEVPDSVMRAYGLERLRFGPDYLIPKPFDPRVLLWVAPAVAWAAVGSGVAGRVIDVDEYRAELDARLGRAREVMRGLSSRAQTVAQRIVFPEGEDPRILKAARILADDGVAEPILLGDPDAIRREADDAGVTLEEIASATAEFVGRLGIEPRVALLSFSNFGSVRHPAAEKVQRAVALLHEREPALQADGEMQADTAVVERILTRTYPFSRLRGAANVLIFPNLDAANISYKLLSRVGGAEAIGPILVGMAQPVHVLQRGSEVNDIVNMAVIAAVDAQEHGRRSRA